MRKFISLLLVASAFAFTANAQSPLMGDTVILKAQNINDEVHITLDQDALLDTLEALGVLEGRTIGAGISSLLALYDSVQTVSAGGDPPAASCPTPLNYSSWVSSCFTYPTSGQVGGMLAPCPDVDPTNWDLVLIYPDQPCITALIGNSGSLTFTQGSSTATVHCNNWGNDNGTVVCHDDGGSQILTVTATSGTFLQGTPFTVTVSPD